MSRIEIKRILTFFAAILPFALQALSSKTRTLGHALSLHLLAKNRTIMGNKTRLKIGEFSRLMQVTVKTLRHYEQKELLIPKEVDEWTGYRYYSIDQMLEMSNI